MRKSIKEIGTCLIICLTFLGNLLSPTSSQLLSEIKHNFNRSKTSAVESIIYGNEREKLSPNKNVNYKYHRDYTMYYQEKKPNITLRLQDMKVIRNGQAIFLCASSGNPVPRIKWLVNENANLPRRYSLTYVSPQKSVLRLNAADTRDNRTRITCQSGSLMGSVYSHASITVYKSQMDVPAGFPKLASKSSVIVNEKNSKILLDCNVKGFPKPSIIWFKDTIPVDLENPRLQLLESGSLQINKTLEEDDGSYECMASNKHGSIVSPTIRLMIRVSYFAPHFVKLPKDHSVAPGSSLTLTCKAVGNPVPKVFWKCGQTILRSSPSNSSNEKGESTVILSDLSESLRCTCIAKNNKESIEHSILVSIHEFSSTQISITLQINRLMATSVTLSWFNKNNKYDKYNYRVTIQRTDHFINGKNITITKLVPKMAYSDQHINTQIQGLQPFTNYTVWIHAISEQGDFDRSNILNFTTLELPPSSAPKNVELSAISNGAVAVMWEPPDESNGIITAYNIYYTTYKTKALSLWNKYTLKIEDMERSQRLTSILSHLYNNATYYICISAQNGAGSGPVTEAYPILVRAGVVQGPKHLKAVAKSASEIQLFWEPIVPRTQINIESYQLFYMIKSQQRDKMQRVWKYSPDQKELSISNLLPNTTYVLQLSAVTSSGPGMMSSVEATTYDTACNVKIDDLEIKSSKSRTIVLCWNQISNLNEKIKIKLLFKSIFNSFNISIYPSSNGHKCHKQIEHVYPNVIYNITSVMETMDCRMNEGFRYITQAELPSMEEPINIYGKAVNSTTIEVFWTITNQMRKNAIYYRIQCRRVYSNGTVSGKNITDIYVKNNSVMDNQGTFSYTFNQLNPNTPYQVYLNVITRFGSGTTFKSKYISTWPKRIPKLQYLHLRLTCAIHRPCVELKWGPSKEQIQWIKGYRIRFYYINDNGKIDGKVIEKNVTDTNYQTSASDHYQGFRYEFQVAPFSQYEIGEESLGHITILEGIPSAYPDGFRMKDLTQNNPTSVSFIWKRLSPRNINGKFNHYQMKCYIVGEKKKSETLYKIKDEAIIVNNLSENKEYACSIRVWNGNAGGPWSNEIYFKTNDAYLPAPEKIRVIRFSHSTAHITWLWKNEFPIYYSHFLIYYRNDKSVTNSDLWSVISTKFPFTKITLSGLNASVSYMIRLSSVSKRGIEGPMSAIVKESTLGSDSWPAKKVSKASCAPETSREIQLFWEAAFRNSELSHFRINFTGVTKFQSEKRLVSLMRDEEEQSANADIVSMTHQLKSLRPNTQYTITIEPIFEPISIHIGGQVQLICTTLKEPPLSVAQLSLINIDKEKRQINLLLHRPNSENGTVDAYYILVSSKDKINLLNFTRRKREIKDDLSLENLLSKYSTSDMPVLEPYISLSLKGDDIFPLENPEVSTHSFKIGTGKTVGTITDKKLDDAIYYQLKILACIRLMHFRKESFKCSSSSWTEPININTSIPQKDEIPIITPPLTKTQSNKGPSTFTMTTVVVILAIVILTILTISIFILLKRRNKLKSKLGVMYGSHSTRKSKEKTLCMDNLLKEPLVESSARISTSESLRFSHHGTNYLEINKLQLTSTPDLLVRSSVNQPMTSVVIFHGQNGRTYEPIPIHVDVLGDHVAKLKENDGKAFSLEYESIEPGQQFTWNVSNLDVNRSKNRYANVIAYDHCRVILHPLLKRKNSYSNETSVVPGSDYINANYIDGFLKPNAYIATQGPLAETIGDFWRMVWEQNSAVIVMMTRLEERDRAKCDQYWPVGGKGSIGTYCNINVTILDMSELAYYTIRKFYIQKFGCVDGRNIYQLQFTAWPDHGVPNHPAPLLMFLRRVQAENPRDAGPMIVHCSAGVGRTGAFIVIDYMLERLHYENTVDIYNYVTSIRAQRNYMVQTEEQYIFIHEALLEAVQCGNTEVSVSELANHIETLNQIEINHRTTDGVQMTGLQMEYEKLLMCSQGFIQGVKVNTNNHSLCSTPTMSLPSGSITSQPLTFETANLSVNQLKNRIMQMLPPDFSRVTLSPIRGLEGSDYINASWIDGYRNRKAYIAAQSPLVNTSEDFWRMLWEHSSSIIIMLTRLKENNRERSHQYWPTQNSARYQFFIVDPVAEYNMKTFIIREFKITDTRDSQSRVIRQFQYVDWRESEGIPESTTALLDVIHQVHKTKAQLGLDGPITVHCSAGTARTGIFIALSNILDRMKNESVVDLFQTVKLLRWQRPALIQSEDQYQFCYVAALEYLKIYEQIHFE